MKRPPATPPAPPAPLRVHRGLVWLTGEPEQVEALARDPHIAPLVLARPTAGLLGFARSSVEKVTARLAKLGTVPRREEGL
jgi:hypothetical protein